MPRAGFTLVEILLVTVLIAILVSIVTPQFRRSFQSVQYKSFVLDLATLLRYARDKALLEKDAYGVRYLPNPPGFRLERASGKDPSGELQKISDRTGVTHRFGPTIQADVDPELIVFYPDGSATAAEWKLSDSRGKSTTLRVAEDSGDILLEGSDG